MLAFISFAILAFIGRSYLAILAFAFLSLICWSSSGVGSTILFEIFLFSTLAFALLFGFKPLRVQMISKPIMKLFSQKLPTIGETEDIALKAGTVWWEGSLFQGKPNWTELLNFKTYKLTAEEQKFLDGPAEKLCEMVDDWKLSQDKEIPKEIWDFIKKHKFLGMVIEKKYGGLGFSASLHSAVVTKLASRSAPITVTVMVPNSLGPGELLHHYGTEKQKKHYLPRLAKGDEIPCFALTEPHAGSDAANGRSIGVVCKKTVNGKKVTGIKVTFDKRYITLAPIATVVGLAFNAVDPDGLLGDKKDLGITCALLPRDTKGLKIGDRHDPLSVPFHNGTVQGKDVFIPLDYVIGGKECIGKGWQMLMDCLSVGRSVSLPSMSVGATELTLRATSAYTNVRQQFGISIAGFEGIQERLARITGSAYWMAATKDLICSAVDSGEKPSVLSAISKAYLTENMRMCVNDGMDIMAGSAIIQGPRNILAKAYRVIPVGITVEGANIMTRSLMVFGQGALRCHPFLLKEINAVQKQDLEAFDSAFMGHMNHIIQNAVRAPLMAISFGWLALSPISGREAKYYRKVTRLAAAFALIADVSLLMLGGAMKRKEFLSGRFADAFAWLFIASASLKRYQSEVKTEESLVLLDWSVSKACYEAEQALVGVLNNLPNKAAAIVLGLLSFPLGATTRKITDKQTYKTARVATHGPKDVRAMLTKNIFIPKATEEGLGKLDAGFKKIIKANDAVKKLHIARRKGEISKAPVEQMAEEAAKKKIISAAELKKVLDAEVIRNDLIQVDSFTADAYMKLR
jgi:acyl-CoA dehydrogenase